MKEAALAETVYHLVVSVPPHRPDWNVAKSASCFGITPAEMRVKASYPAPEVWFAEADDAAAELKYAILLEAGLNVVFSDTRILSRIPTRSIVKGFSVRKGCISWDLDHDGESVATPFESKVIIVYGKPKTANSYKVPDRGGAGATGTEEATPGRWQDGGADLVMSEKTQPMVALAQALHPTFLEVYLGQEAGIHRLALCQGQVDFAGLGERKRSTFGENCAALAALISSSFQSAQEDLRLLDFIPRKIAVLGVGAQKFLDTLPVAKPPLEPIDLASRLIFLTSSWA